MDSRVLRSTWMSDMITSLNYWIEERHADHSISISRIIPYFVFESLWVVSWDGRNDDISCHVELTLQTASKKLAYWLHRWRNGLANTISLIVIILWSKVDDIVTFSFDQRIMSSETFFLEYSTGHHFHIGSYDPFQYRQNFRRNLLPGLRSRYEISSLCFQAYHSFTCIPVSLYHSNESPVPIHFQATSSIDHIEQKTLWFLSFKFLRRRHRYISSDHPRSTKYAEDLFTDTRTALLDLTVMMIFSTITKMIFLRATNWESIDSWGSSCYRLI